MIGEGRYDWGDMRTRDFIWIGAARDSLMTTSMKSRAAVLAAAGLTLWLAAPGEAWDHWYYLPALIALGAVAGAAGLRAHMAGLAIIGPQIASYLVMRWWECQWRRKRVPIWRVERGQRCGYAMDSPARSGAELNSSSRLTLARLPVGNS